MLSRRAFVKYGVFGATALAIGGVGLGFQQTKAVEPPSPLKVFSPDEFSILSAISDRLFPENPPFVSGSSAGVPILVDELMSTMPPLVVNEFKQGLALLENALTGLIFGATLTPFSQCSPMKQDQILEEWRTSSLKFRRMVFRGISAICAGAYYGKPSSFSAIGYGGPNMALNPEARL